MELGFWTSSIDRTFLGKNNQLTKLIEVVDFPPLSGSTYIGFLSYILGNFRLVLGSQSLGTIGKNL